MKKTLPIFRLFRAIGFDQGTPGMLISNRGEHVCYMMELPDRDNAVNKSRIPSGRYLVKYLDATASGKFKEVYHVTDVPGRTGILSHTGNYAGDITLGYQSDSWGCLLPALRLGELNNQLAGLASRAAMRKLHAVTGRKDFILEVY